MLGRIRGNEAFKESVQAALQAGRLSNSVLLCAEEGCGAGFAARCLAADFLYPEGGAAAEAVLEGRSSECVEVRGQGQRGEILVGQARQVRSLVYETALSAAGRVVIFYGAHRMNPSAANALLKVLEEPPAGVLFLLTAPSAAAVLATIRSRCGLFLLSPVTTAQCEAYLKETCPACPDPALLARVYAGRIGPAKAAADPAARRSLDAALELAKAAGKADRYETMRLLAAFEKDRSAAARLLEDLACVAAAVLEGAEGLGLSLEAAARCAEGCTEARRGMDRSLNQKLLFTVLAAKLCDAAG